jgi:hypothetical protein
MMPGAIDVTGVVPVSGKPWVGGEGNAKLVLHTIEGADPDTIGWPRDWTKWTYAPHLVMNSDRWPDKDWLYQTLPFDKAAYAIRNNSLEDDAYTYQIEIAAQAASTPDYPDSFYEALAQVCQWFIDEMRIVDVWLDFSCCSYGLYTDCRLDKAAVDDFSGFLGHCHVGRGIDTHGDPGHLDVGRLQSFMDPQPPPEVPMENQGRNELYVKQGMSGMSVEYWQVMSIMAVEGIKYYGNSNRTFIADNAPELTFREWDTAMTTYLSSWTGRNSYGVGATERVMIEAAVREVYSGNSSTPSPKPSSLHLRQPQ